MIADIAAIGLGRDWVIVQSGTYGEPALKQSERKATSACEQIDRYRSRALTRLHEASPADA